MLVGALLGKSDCMVRSSLSRRVERGVDGVVDVDARDIGLGMGYGR